MVPKVHWKFCVCIAVTATFLIFMVILNKTDLMKTWNFPPKQSTVFSRHEVATADDVNNPNPVTCLNISRQFLIFPSGHHCLYKLANSYCYDRLSVPNLVHYVYFDSTKFYFYNLISVLSSYRILHPCFIYIHGNNIPKGKWWNHLLELVPNIVFVKTDVPRRVFQKPVKVIQHSSDVARLQILLAYGGIYMDSDQVALKSFDPLRKYDITLSRGSDQTFGNAVIIASKDSTFLRIWYLSYADFNDDKWNYHSCQLPYRLAKLLPGIIHPEKVLFFGFEKSVHYIFRGICDWSHRYGLHLYYRHQRQIPDYDPEQIKNMNTTYGEIARYIYYNESPGNRIANC